MREICQSGSEGGASQTNGTFLPLSRDEATANKESTPFWWVAQCCFATWGYRRHDHNRLRMYSPTWGTRGNCVLNGFRARCHHVQKVEGCREFPVAGCYLGNRAPFAGGA